MSRPAPSFATLLLIAALHAPNAAAQVDSVAMLRDSIRAIMSATVYWPDILSESAVKDCQLHYANFCGADHIRVGVLGGLTASIVRRASITRNALLADFARAQAFAPTDGWFLGQLVFLNVQTGQSGRAQQLLQTCHADKWWCLALKGYVLQHDSWYASADSAFTEALAAMPPDLNCKWRDISLLLDDASEPAYHALDCNARRAVEDRVWWLADPLYLVEGNDRRTDHYSRRVLDSLVSGSYTAFAFPALSSPDDQLAYLKKNAANVRSKTWNHDLSDMLIQYGMPSHWISTPDWAHFTTPSYHFIPSAAALQPGAEITPADWALAIPLDKTRERYAPPYGHIAQLTQYQIAQFRRGDSMLVAFALDVAAEPIHEAAPFVAASVLSAGPASIQMSVGRGATDKITLLQRTPRSPMLFGVEVASRDLQVAGRLRVTLDTARTLGPALSDLLLFTPAPTPPKNLDQALVQMRGASHVIRTEPLGVYWEMYGFQPGAEVTYTISVTPVRVESGFMTRVARALRLGSKPGIVLVRWHEPSATVGEGAGHSIAVDMRTLSPGTYLLEMTCEGANGARASESRLVDVVAKAVAPARMAQALAQDVPGSSEGNNIAPIQRRPQPLPPAP
jgi:hypothetical protein